MKTKIIYVLIIILFNALQAQTGLINNGAYIKINPGTKVYLDGNSNGNFTISESGQLDLKGWLTLEGELNNNGIMTMDTSASLIDYGLSTGTGTTNFKKCIDGQHCLFSLPVYGLTAGDITGFDLERYDEPDSNWVSLNPSDSLLKMVGYSPTPSLGNKKVTTVLAGLLNTGNTELTLQMETDGLNLVGNPYPSGIDWNAVVLSNNNIDKTLYAWNGYNYSYFLSNGGLSINGGKPYIEAADAFFVKANNSGPLTMTNSMRIHNFESSPPETEIMGSYLYVTVNDNIYKDETLIYFISTASVDYDPDYDARKLHTPVIGVPQVFTSCQGNDYAINSLPLNGTVEVPLGFKAWSDGVYQFEFTDFNLDSIDRISIIDKKFSDQPLPIYENNSWVDSPSFSFDYSTSDTIKWFTLVFERTSTKIDQNNITEKLKIYANNKTVYVDLDIVGHEFTTLSFYNIQGMLVYKDNAFKGLNAYNMEQFIPGVYIIRTVLHKNAISKKIMLK